MVSYRFFFVISLNLSNVCNMIKAGAYLLIYDPEQDIRGCDYLKDK